jgi:hypothetical protein
MGYYMPARWQDLDIQVRDITPKIKESNTWGCEYCGGANHSEHVSCVHCAAPMPIVPPMRYIYNAGLSAEQLDRLKTFMSTERTILWPVR